MKHLWLPFAIGLLLTAVLFYFGIIFSKGGDRTFSLIFFPYTSLLELIPHRDSGGPGRVLGYSIFFLQYPIYGLLLGSAFQRGDFYRWLLIILAAHILLSIICFATLRR